MTDKMKDRSGSPKSSLEEETERTRLAIVDKLHTVEDRINSAIGDLNVLVQTSKVVFDELKENVDLKEQTDKHPVAMVFGSALLGFVLSKVVRQPKSILKQVG